MFSYYPIRIRSQPNMTRKSERWESVWQMTKFTSYFQSEHIQLLPWANKYCVHFVVDAVKSTVLSRTHFGFGVFLYRVCAYGSLSQYLVHKHLTLTACSLSRVGPWFWTFCKVQNHRPSHFIRPTDNRPKYIISLYRMICILINRCVGKGDVCFMSVLVPDVGPIDFIEAVSTHFCTSAVFCFVVIFHVCRWSRCNSYLNNLAISKTGFPCCFRFLLC